MLWKEPAAKSWKQTTMKGASFISFQEIGSNNPCRMCFSCARRFYAGKDFVRGRHFAGSLPNIDGVVQK